MIINEEGRNTLYCDGCESAWVDFKEDYDELLDLPLGWEVIDGQGSGPDYYLCADCAKGRTLPVSYVVFEADLDQDLNFAFFHRLEPAQNHAKQRSLSRSKGKHVLVTEVCAVFKFMKEGM